LRIVRSYSVGRRQPPVPSPENPLGCLISGGINLPGDAARRRWVEPAAARLLRPHAVLLQENRLPCGGRVADLRDRWIGLRVSEIQPGPAVCGFGRDAINQLTPGSDSSRRGECHAIIIHQPVSEQSAAALTPPCSAGAWSGRASKASRRLRPMIPPDPSCTAMASYPVASARTSSRAETARR